MYHCSQDKDCGIRLGQYFCNKYVKGQWSELFYCEDEDSVRNIVSQAYHCPEAVEYCPVRGARHCDVCFHVNTIEFYLEFVVKQGFHEINNPIDKGLV